MTTFRRKIRALVLLLGLMIVARAAHAQSASHLGIGLDVDFYRPTHGELFQRSTGVGLLYRWHTFHSHWGPTFGFDWESAHFDQPVGAATVPFGSLRKQTFLVGLGYTLHLGPLVSSSNLTGGYELHRLRLDGGAVNAYGNAGLVLVGAQVRNSPAGQADTSLWFDVTKRIGIAVSAAYNVARPEIIITTATSSASHHLRTDALEYKVGLVIGLDKRKKK